MPESLGGQFLHLQKLQETKLVGRAFPLSPPILNRVKRFFAFYVVIKKYLIISGRNLNRSLVSDWDIVIHKTSNRKSKFHQILKHSRQLKKNFQKSQAHLPPSYTNFSKSVLKIITKMILLNYMFLHIDVWQEHTKDRIYQNPNDTIIQQIFQTST